MDTGHSNRLGAKTKPSGSGTVWIGREAKWLDPVRLNTPWG
jgi:hypothetical protein